MRITVFRCSLLLFSLFSVLVLAVSPAATSTIPAHVDSVQARDHMAAGAGYFEKGSFAKGLSEWARALELFKAAGDRSGEGRALLNRGSAYLALGRYREAVDSLRLALDAVTGLDESALLLKISASLANAYIILGMDEKGEQLLEYSITMARGARDSASMAAALNNLGNLHAARQHYGKAISAYSESLAYAGRSGLDALAAKAAVNLARTLLSDGKAEQAKSALDKALTMVQKLTPSHSRAYALISLGRLYARLEDSVPISRMRGAAALQEAVETAELTGDYRALSYASGYLGQMYEEDSRLDEALQLTRRARNAAAQVNAPESLYQWQWQTGRILRAQGDTGSAVAAYQRALYTLQTLRQDLSGDHLVAGGSFRSTYGPIFLEYADLLLVHSESTTDTEQIEHYLRRVRETVELLKGAELEDYFQDDCVAALKKKTTGIDKLALHTAAIYPIIFEDRLELLLSLPEGLKRFTSPVTAEALVREVRALRSLLEKRSTHQYMPHAQKVYNWIIRPLESSLRQSGVDTLVIVPDGALRTIPMAALHDGQHFLIHRYAIATTPGLTLTDPRPLLREKMQVLSGGLTESVQGFPPLPNVDEELDDIQSQYGGKVLKDQTFTIPNMESELTRIPYSIVHLASHGQFERDVSKTFLLTYDGKLSMNALEQYLAISKYRKYPVELLTLSACQTAAGDDRAALGLAGIAIKAGARSALATLWYISDRASSILVTEFYRQLQNSSLSKVRALQQAQLSLLKDRRYRHPGYWSPFLLIGNWL